MRIAVTGASGLIGSALFKRLAADGHEVLPVVRNPEGGKGSLFWDSVRGEIHPAEWEALDAVVHLAGENIGGGRWSAARKARIRDSRVLGTRLISETLAKVQHPPKVLISASAVGYYGPRASHEELDESAPAGQGFLAEVCRAWEQAAQAAANAGIRTCWIRTGVVLSPQGGALEAMLPVFRLGLGGRLGRGDQVMSWIALEDVIEAIVFLLDRDDLSGAFNLAAPNPVSNAEFVRALAHVLRRPALFPVPGLALKVVLGEMAGPLLLTGQRALPRRLLESGFVFRETLLEPALPGILSSS